MDHPEVAADLGGVVGLEEILSGSDPVSSSTVPMSGNGRAGSKSPLPPGKDVSIVEKDSGVITFPPEVESAISAVFPSEDPLDQPDFSTVDYVNKLFPTEQSLNNLDDVMGEMKYKIACTDDDIRRIVRNQTHAGQEAAAALEEAQTAIGCLFSQIRDIKAKAGESEAMVRDITRDIKQLDTAKRNLTNAITTLNYLHMLVGGVSTLTKLSEQRQYGEAANLLQGLMEVLEHFKSYSDIPQIKELSDQVESTRAKLGQQVQADFKSAFSDDEGSTFIPDKQFAEACLVVDALEPRVKKDLLNRVTRKELAEYKIIFSDSEEIAWLDKIESRYNWLKKHLMDFEERLGPMFPPDWDMSERMTAEFCVLTRKQFERLLFKRKHEIDVKLLLHAVQKTTNFESLLHKRFPLVDLNKLDINFEANTRRESRQKDSTNPFEVSEDESAITDPENPFYEGEPKVEPTKQPPKTQTTASNGNSFSGLISSCFEPYLSIYIESQDRNLNDLVERAANEQKTRGCANMSLEGSAVLHSCGDLFMFYKKCMVQCSQLSSGESLQALSEVFKKHLREYAAKVLMSNVPKAALGSVSSSSASVASTLTASMASLSKDLKKDFSTQGLISNFQSLLKESTEAAAAAAAGGARLNADEKTLICSFLLTAEYCLETTQQLEAKIKEKIDSNLASRVDMGPEQDVYHSVINSCLQMLVQDLEVNCDVALAAMSKIGWSQVEAVGDQSAYVTTLAGHLKATVPLIRDNLSSSRKYFTQYCVKFVNSFIPKFIQHLFRCKPISTVGAEQLLLDTHSVKTLLLDLPTLGNAANPSGGLGGKMTPASQGASAASRKAPASYTKIVVKGMTRAEMTLKVVMSHHDPLEAFVEQYIKLVPDVDTTEFQKVLDMKGIRRVDQVGFIDYFKTTAPQNASLLLTSPPLLNEDRHNRDNMTKGLPAIRKVHSKSSATSSTAATTGEESRIKKLENLIKGKRGI